MKTRLLLTLLGALAAGAVGLSGTAVAQGGGGGGGGGGGSPEPPDYGDLVLLYRDASGVPIPTPLTAPDLGLCQQPLAFPENVGCPDEGLISHGDILVVPVDPATCAIEPEYATCVQEADFGRVNLSRASDRVLASQLQDVLVNIAIADCTSLDPAGRMVYSRYVGDELVTGTIDSPLQNLAVYKYLMLDGEIGVPLPQSAGVLETAARGFGVAMDKAGEVNIDLLVYLNQIMGLTDPDVDTYLFKVSQDFRMEVMGNMETVTKWFLDYTRIADGTASMYTYDRQTNFAGPLPDGLPSPAYLPPPPEVPQPGKFEFLQDLGGGSYAVALGWIMEIVFGDDPGYSGGNIGGFAESADDTREVIHFMHSYAVPDADKTPVPCTPPADPTDQYDLSISAKSGLKVPKQVVATTEGRELIVTIGNAGPDTAAGTLTVTANTDAGGEVVLLVEDEVDGHIHSPFVFEFVNVGVGATWDTGVQYFMIEAPYASAKITWTAVVEPAAGAEDPYMGNNAVTATSNVRVTGGGGGH